MNPYAFLYHFIHAALATSLGTGIAIVVGTFILEDATLVAVGVMASDRLVSVPLALSSLAAGIALGDFGLYGLGRLAASYKPLRAWVESRNVHAVRSWLNDELYTTVVATRFLPGLRLPTYLACGFFCVPFGKFATAVLGAVLVWSALVFSLAYWFGVYTLTWLGLWRWPIALGAVAILLVAGHAHWRRMTEKR
jgi:membrane protein DedA with SNARE-associated domain